MLVVGTVVVLLVGIHVDDLVLVGVDSRLRIQWLRSALLCEFKMEDIGVPPAFWVWIMIFALMALSTFSRVPTSPSFSTSLR